MADLQFVDQHNMVACLERTDGNAEFHQIVDFLTTRPIHHALTVSPTIYASYIEQFWATAKFKTVNDVKQIHATVDGKKIVISESSVKSDLHFNNEDAPSTTQPIIEEQIPVTESSSPQNTQSPRQTLQKDTQLPQTSVPIPNVADEAVFKEWDDRVMRATTTAASLDAAQASGNITKTQSTEMSNDPLTQEIGSGGRPRCQKAMRGAITQTRSERASKHSYDSPLTGVNTPINDEGRPYLNELMDIYTILFDRVFDLEKEKDAQAVEIVDSSDDSLGEKNASKQGRNDSNKTEELNLSDKGSGGTEVFDDTTAAEKDVNAAEPVSTAGDAVNAASIIPNVSTTGHSNVSAAGPSTSTTGDIFEDEVTTIVDTLVAIRSTRPRTTSVVICNVEEEPRRATLVPTVQIQDKGKGKMVEPEPTPKNPIKAQIQRDAEIA
ncbi:hypothetical protein Tco_0652462 [Tanacetum coccineum]|uniref:Xylulose kinase-1 n=1 Tax=Tanacetum coccineum TaxID=301880 RepID=A0ABQ4WXX3_9ASTR